MEKGILLVISGSSGTGKTTLANMITRQCSNSIFSVSFTTRPIRPHEIDGRDYHFIQREKMEEMIANGDFAEYMEFCGNMYGTSKKKIEDHIASGMDVVFDINLDGYLQLKKSMPDEVVGIFLLPPSKEELLNRLRSRPTSYDSEINDRIKNIKLEILQWEHYDYVVYNNSIDDAFNNIKSILIAEKSRRKRISYKIKEFVSSLEVDL